MTRRLVHVNFLIVLVGLTVAALTAGPLVSLVWSAGTSASNGGERSSGHDDFRIISDAQRVPSLVRSVTLHVGIVILVHHHPAPRDAAFFAGTARSTRPTPAEVSRFHALTLDGALVLKHSVLSRTAAATATNTSRHLKVEGTIMAAASESVPLPVHNRQRRCWREFAAADEPTSLLLERDGDCTVPVHELDDIPWSALTERHRIRPRRTQAGVRVVSSSRHHDEPVLRIRLRFVALVTPTVSAAHLAVLRRYGFETWATNDSVVDLQTVESASYRRDVVDDGAFGYAELAKLKALRMGAAGMFDTVVVLDNDIMFHQSLVELLRECLPSYVRRAVGGDDDRDVQAVDGGAEEEEEVSREEAGTRRRRGSPVLFWTRGGIPTEPINGGYLIFSPRSSANGNDMGEGSGDHHENSLARSSSSRRNATGSTDAAHPAAALQQHYENLLAIVRRGNYTPEAGWEGSGIGRGTHGGRTLQGILPYYFLHVLQRRGDAANRSPFVHLPSSESFSFSREIDRCRFNNMVQLPRCQAMSGPRDDVVSNHFTGGCLKPWKCFTRTHPLCARFVDEWLQEYRIAATAILRAMENEPALASPQHPKLTRTKKNVTTTTNTVPRGEPTAVWLLRHFLGGLARHGDGVSGSGECLPPASERSKHNRLLLRKVRNRRDLVFVSLTETLLKSTM